MHTLLVSANSFAMLPNLLLCQVSSNSTPIEATAITNHRACFYSDTYTKCFDCPALPTSNSTQATRSQPLPTLKIMSKLHNPNVPEPYYPKPSLLVLAPCFPDAINSSNCNSLTLHSWG
ncbi:hypothetical protein KC19_7G028100 [Ceratodon purpureus]|uniref:Uncharacterized protein n=1 Tax=Ceratodon purpureus TaxID=3225 RepID=A0A8T0H417_CERPU|nr:hypothetical protein KC19_7G028100 [Ceratodon purpureus]